MDPALIRFIPDSRKVSKKIQKVQTKEDKQIQLPGSLPLGLLQNDRSTLTTNEWTLLSNCLHAFDEQNPSARIQNSLNELTSLPPKLRLKPLELTNLIRELFSSIGPLIERSSDFHSLPVNVRQILVKRNLYITGSMNGLFLCQCRRKIARYDPNGSLIKIFVFILAFSSNCSLVTYDSQADLTIMSNSIHLVPIQNVYITMLWKYLIYLYGFKEAVLRFTRLIKDVLDLVNMLSQAPQTETRSRIMNPIVTETEHTLMNGN
ncbi:unnamed protein product [Rotaria sp. Silwood1]|nr:unnamed protein product [Rotaria sp. Silwood1]